MNALTMAYGLTRTEFIPKVRFTFSLPKPRHFYSFFFPFPRVTILTRTFPRTETFSINYIPLAAPSLRYLISYLSPRIQRTVFQPRDSLILMDVKKKKTFTLPIGHPFPLPAIRFWRETLSNPSRIPLPLLRWTNFHRRVTRRLTVRNTVFLFIFLFFSAAKFNPKPADWCVELYLSRGAAAV